MFTFGAELLLTVCRGGRYISNRTSYSSAHLISQLVCVFCAIIAKKQLEKCSKANATQSKTEMNIMPSQCCGSAKWLNSYIQNSSSQCLEVEIQPAIVRSDCKKSMADGLKAPNQLSQIPNYMWQEEVQIRGGDSFKTATQKKAGWANWAIVHMNKNYRIQRRKKQQ